MTPTNSPRPLGWTFRLLVDATIAVAGFASVMGLALLVTPEDVPPQFGRMFASILLTCLLLVVLIAAGAVLRAGRWRTWMKLSMVLSTLGGLGLVVLMWYRPLPEWPQTTAFGSGRIEYEVLVLCASTPLITGGALAHSGALHLVPARGSVVRGLVVTTCASAWMTAALTIGFIWLVNTFAGEMRFLNVLIIAYISLAFFALLTVAGTIVTPIVALSDANRQRREGASLGNRPSIDMTCPRCGERQTFRAGLARCRRCRARLRVEIEEPRCACGYALYQLTREKCPECGRTISERLRWQGKAKTAEAVDQRVLTAVESTHTSASLNE